MAKAQAGDKTKAQAKALWDDVKTQSAWDALTNAQRLEDVRRAIKWLLKQEFGDELTE